MSSPARPPTPSTLLCRRCGRNPSNFPRCTATGDFHPEQEADLRHGKVLRPRSAMDRATERIANARRIAGIIEAEADGDARRRQEETQTSVAALHADLVRATVGSASGPAERMVVAGSDELCHLEEVQRNHMVIEEGAAWRDISTPMHREHLRYNSPLKPRRKYLTPGRIEPPQKSTLMFDRLGSETAEDEERDQSRLVAIEEELAGLSATDVEVQMKLMIERETTTERVMLRRKFRPFWPINDFERRARAELVGTREKEIYDLRTELWEAVRPELERAARTRLEAQLDAGVEHDVATPERLQRGQLMCQHEERVGRMQLLSAVAGELESAAVRESVERTHIAMAHAEQAAAKSEALEDVPAEAVAEPTTTTEPADAEQPPEPVPDPVTPVAKEPEPVAAEPETAAPAKESDLPPAPATEEPAAVAGEPAPVEPVAPLADPTEEPAESTESETTEAPATAPEQSTATETAPATAVTNEPEAVPPAGSSTSPSAEPAPADPSAAPPVSVESSPTTTASPPTAESIPSTAEPEAVPPVAPIPASPSAASTESTTTETSPTAPEAPVPTATESVSAEPPNTAEPVAESTSAEPPVPAESAAVAPTPPAQTEAVAPADEAPPADVTKAPVASAEEAAPAADVPVEPVPVAPVEVSTPMPAEPPAADSVPDAAVVPEVAPNASESAIPAPAEAPTAPVPPAPPTEEPPLVQVVDADVPEPAVPHLTQPPPPLNEEELSSSTTSSFSSSTDYTTADPTPAKSDAEKHHAARASASPL